MLSGGQQSDNSWDEGEEGAGDEDDYFDDDFA